MAGREEGIPLREAFIRFRDLVSADMDWADSRKVRYRQRAWLTKVAALALTAASTVVLGIPAIPERAAIALPMVALVTVFGGIEAYFNWRSIWVLMEETQYRLNRIRDEMDYYIVTTPGADLNLDRLRGFFTEQQDIWHDVSRRWVEFRRLDQSDVGGSAKAGLGQPSSPGGSSMRPRCSLKSWQQIAFRRSGSSVLGSTWASRERDECALTWP
jgi:hypothetical protein